MPDVAPPWTDVLAAVGMLEPREQATLALLGAQRLVAAGPADVRALRLAALLGVGWGHLDDGAGLEELAAGLDELDGRADLDDNEVAAVSYALTAALGASARAAEEPARWTVMRVVDAAFESAAEEDASHPVVQGELGWLRSAVFSLRQRGATPDVVADLRGT